MFLEGIGDVFQEDEAEDDVLVFRRIHVVAELIGGEPELRLEADGGGGVDFPDWRLRHKITFCLERVFMVVLNTISTAF